MGMTTEQEELLLRVYASGMVSGIVTYRLNEKSIRESTPATEVPPFVIDAMANKAVTHVHRYMDDPVVRQQVLDMIAADAPLAVVLRLGRGQ